MSPPNSNVPPVSLPILVTFPVAPAWLVSRYLVSTGYQIRTEVFSGGNGEFDHNGGTFRGTIVPNAHGDWPGSATVATTVEYTPESGLANLSKTDTLPVTPAGTSVTVQLPNRRMTNISIILEFPHGILDGDSLTIRWAYLLGGQAKTEGSLFLDREALLPGLPRPARPISIGFIQDPAPTVPEQFRLALAGQIFQTDLTPFQKDLPLPQSLIVAKIKDDASPGTGIHVELS